MKTAIIKTSFWEDDKVFQLNVDTKLLYLFLLTAPQRNTTRFYMLTDRLISAYVGLSDRALDLCKKQLQDSEMVFFVDGWVVLGDGVYVKPNRGKLTMTIYPQDMENVPEKIRQFALDRNLNFELSTEKTSGVAQEYIYNNKDKTNVVKIKTDTHHGIDYDTTSEVFEFLDNGDVKFKNE